MTVPLRQQPPLIVVAGPSGCGKTTIARAIMQRHPEFLFSVSATTRPKRSTETDGVDYHFITREEFTARIGRGELIEWEEIYGDLYGSLRSEVERARASGVPMIFDVDVKGALSIRGRYPAHAFLIFIRPPSLEVLRERLRNRKTETPETFERRMQRVAMELELADQFDTAVVNDILERAIDEADAVVRNVIVAVR